MSWFTLLLLAFGCGNNEDVRYLDPPVLTSIFPDSVSAGDTIVVSGSNFNPDYRDNRIVFSPCAFSNPECRRLSPAFSGNDSELRGVVPGGVLTGSIRIEDESFLQALTILGPEPLPFPTRSLPVEVKLKQGDVGKAFFSGTQFDITFEAGDSGEEFLLILFDGSALQDDNSIFDYWVGGATGAVRRVDVNERLSRPVRDAMEHAHYGTRYRRFKRRIREGTIEMLKRFSPGTGAIQGGTYGRDAETDGSVPLQNATFYVLVDPDISPLNPSNYTEVEAGLKYTGAHTLLYVDSDTQPGKITDTEAAELGRHFDEMIYYNNKTYFGNESDINRDGKITILLTPVVNGMTPYVEPGEGIIAGFFLPGDLLPGVAPRSNSMEIFYSMVPDTVWWPVEQEWQLEVIRGVLAHEFQHQIMFNYRVLIYGDGVSGEFMEELWIDEGMSHIAEDLSGHNNSNILRANLFLKDPGDAHLLYRFDDSLEARGAAYLFFRYLGDQFGNDIFRRLVQSKKTNTENIEQATADGFLEVFADWSATCYLSGLTVTEDPRYSYTSIDLKGDFSPLFVTQVDFSSESILGDVKRTAPEYILFPVAPHSLIQLNIDGDSAGRMNAVFVRVQ